MWIIGCCTSRTRVYPCRQSSFKNEHLKGTWGVIYGKSMNVHVVVLFQYCPTYVNINIVCFLFFFQGVLQRRPYFGPWSPPSIPSKTAAAATRTTTTLTNNHILHLSNRDPYRHILWSLDQHVAINIPTIRSVRLIQKIQQDSFWHMVQGRAGNMNMTEAPHFAINLPWHGFLQEQSTVDESMEYVHKRS